ncbi:hypothetical protein BT69DRAFT_1334068 [Atractiella rhizophila]|nr:hypothetical protein BT69DRAFT_1334068 [Atractiella rhizophila]
MEETGVFRAESPDPSAHPAPLDEDVPMSDLNAPFEDADDDPSDPIIKRLPVFLNPTFSGTPSLALLQYPSRPPKPYTNHPLLPPVLRDDPDGAIKARYKPINSHMELSLPLEHMNRRWNDSKAEEWGKGVEGWEDKKKKGGKLERMSMTSEIVPGMTNYFVGVMRGDELHLNPLNTTIQLRPELSYLDELTLMERRERRRQRLANEQDDSGSGGSDVELDEEEKKAKKASKAAQTAKAVSVKAAEQAKDPRDWQTGIFEVKKRLEEEEWLPLEHYHPDTGESNMVFEKMFGPTDTKLVMVTKPHELLGIGLAQ